MVAAMLRAECIAVIELSLLFANASDYSMKTDIFVRYKYIYLYMQVLLE